jgi:segregation and condensation protein B
MSTPAPPDDEVSFEELASVYARALGMDAPSPVPSPSNDAVLPLDSHQPISGFVVTPQSIVEGALFIGNPDRKPITAAALASLMRDVSEEEIVGIVAELNQLLEREQSAMRIDGSPTGFRMVLREELNLLRDQFHGKLREARLTQSGIEVLSLIAYQQGISASELEAQLAGRRFEVKPSPLSSPSNHRRSKEVLGILAQLLRRELIEMRKVADNHGTKVARYYTTSRFLKVFKLSSLEDLPIVEESTRFPGDSF